MSVAKPGPAVVSARMPFDDIQDERATSAWKRVQARDRGPARRSGASRRAGACRVAGAGGRLSRRRHVLRHQRLPDNGHHRQEAGAGLFLPARVLRAARSPHHSLVAGGRCRLFSARAPFPGVRRVAEFRTERLCDRRLCEQHPARPDYGLLGSGGGFQAAAAQLEPGGRGAVLPVLPAAPDAHRSFARAQDRDFCDSRDRQHRRCPFPDDAARGVLPASRSGVGIAGRRAGGLSGRAAGKSARGHCSNRARGHRGGSVAGPGGRGRSFASRPARGGRHGGDTRGSSRPDAGRPLALAATHGGHRCPQLHALLVASAALRLYASAVARCTGLRGLPAAPAPALHAVVADQPVRRAAAARSFAQFVAQGAVFRRNRLVAHCCRRAGATLHWRPAATSRSDCGPHRPRPRKGHLQ